MSVSTKPEEPEFTNLEDILKGLGLGDIGVQQTPQQTTQQPVQAPAKSSPKFPAYVAYVVLAVITAGSLVYLMRPATPPQVVVDPVAPDNNANEKAEREKKAREEAERQERERIAKEKSERHRRVQKDLIARRDRLGRDLTRRFNSRYWVDDAQERKVVLQDIEKLQTLARQTEDEASEIWKKSAQIAYEKVSAIGP